ncbi:hypothetical protein [Nocardioides sp. W7]|uniref:hypothetical protein n=1 Tax=Nocardioides sp. W7 TaxID=2931390 RepID=UPI001FD4F1B5|nr:hypothetical protein [Nocardioides sp. W7]
MPKLLTLAVAAAAAVLLLLCGGLSASSSTAQAPAPDTIVAVTGDQANGFEIHYYDGSAAYPPTDSEARAECAEYDTHVARVRCRTEVRTWYRDLGDLKQALDWAHAS